MGADRGEDKQSSSKIFDKLKRPGWDSSLQARIPNILLDSPVIRDEEKKPNEGLAQLIKDCRRLLNSKSSQVLFNGQPITQELFPEEIMRSNPNKEMISGFLEDIKKGADPERKKDFISFLNDQMTPKGVEVLLKRFDQSEMGAAGLFLMQAADAPVTTSEYEANFTFSENKGLVLEVVSKNLKTPPDWNKDFITPDTTLGTKLIVSPTGKISREFYTRPEDFPKIYLALLDTYIEKCIEKIKQAPRQQAEEYKQLEAYGTLKKLLKTQSNLKDFFVQNSKNTENLIEIFVNVYSRTLPEINESITAFQDKLKVVEAEAKKIKNKEAKTQLESQLEMIKKVFIELTSPEKLVKLSFDLSKDPTNKDFIAMTAEKTNEAILILKSQIEGLSKSKPPSPSDQKSVFKRLLK